MAEKRSDDEWESLFKAHEESGDSIASFCRARGLCNKYFGVKRRQYLSKQAKDKGASSFTPVKMLPGVGDETIDVVWRGIRVHFPLTQSTKQLSDFIKHLAE